MNRHVASCVIRTLQWARIMFYEALSSGRSRGRAHKAQPVLILGKGIVQFERGVRLGFFPSPFFMSGYIHLEARNSGSSIRIGEGTHINNNFVAIAEHTSITIGKRCFVGANVEILDSDFHGLKVSERATSNSQKAKPVVLGDDVFIGSNVKIMKGVVIGNGSAIANSAIVVRDVPPGVVAGGNPAKVLRTIEGE